MTLNESSIVETRKHRTRMCDTKIEQIDYDQRIHVTENKLYVREAQGETN
jgi:hypothetical protein